MNWRTSSRINQNSFPHRFSSIQWGANILCLLALAGCASAKPRATQQKSPLSSRLQSIFDSQPGAVYGCRIIDLDSGRVIYSHNPDMPVAPASNLKLFVTATALDMFGPDYQLKTTLAYDGKNLWVIGGGDPACGDPSMSRHRHEPITAMFDQWAKVLHKNHIDHIPGHIYYDARIFDSELINPVWDHSMLGEWYAAPVAGLTFNDNCIDVTLYPTKKDQPMRPVVAPPNTLVHLDNQTKTAKGKSPNIHRKGMTDDYVIWGSSTKKSRLASKPVTDPAVFFANAMRTNFASHGITVAGSSMPAPKKQPSDLHTIAVHTTQLADAIKRMDKDSQNLFAEDLDKLAGHEYARRVLHQNLPGSWRLGSAAAHVFLSRHNIDVSKLVMIDGSGLSHQDRITALMMTQMLQYVRHTPYFKAFYDALPISGVDGTIEDRMTDIPGKVRGKTGYISGVRSLSGYITTNGGHHLAYCIIYNKIKGSIMPYQKVQDRICEELVRKD